MPASSPHHVFLIPGFFGFANLGGLVYYAHVSEWLEHAFERAGHRVRVHRVKTRPTASIERRACRVLEAIRSEAADDDGAIHLVGHSSGGLDARLVTTPGAQLPVEEPVEPWARRVRSVVSIATPHRGTPVATFFRSAFGQQVLRVISIATLQALRKGRASLRTMAQLARLFARPRAKPGTPSYGLASQFYDELLEDFSPDRRQAVREFFEDVNADRSLLTQLTPDAISLFNAAAPNRDGVRYGSVVTCAPAPRLGAQLEIGLAPYPQATYALYRAMYRLAGSDAPPPEAGTLTSAQRERVNAELGRTPNAQDNDGVVPTLAQPWGEVIHAVVADHLDVVGHFAAPDREPPHYDWLLSGSGFRRSTFESLWDDVASFMLESA